MHDRAYGTILEIGIAGLNLVMHDSRGRSPHLHYVGRERSERIFQQRPRSPAALVSSVFRVLRLCIVSLPKLTNRCFACPPPSQDRALDPMLCAAIRLLSIRGHCPDHDLTSYAKSHHHKNIDEPALLDHLRAHPPKAKGVQLESSTTLRFSSP